jgi:DNA-binding SARP family transcriptional activator/TolB-like protein
VNYAPQVNYAPKVLGFPTLAVAERAQPHIADKGWALLVALWLNHTAGAPRQTLASLLYAEAAPVTAAANLRQLLRRMTGALPTGLLETNSSLVQLRQGFAVPDVAELMATSQLTTLAQANSTAATRPLLEGISFNEVDLQAWLDAHRRRVQSQVRHLVVSWAAASADLARTQPLVTLLAAEPDDVLVAVALVRALLATGDDWEAARIVEDFADKAAANVVAQSAVDQLRMAATPKATPTLHTNVSAAGAPHPIGIYSLPRLCLLPPTKGAFEGVRRNVLSLVSSLVEDMTIDLTASRDVAVIAPNTAWTLGKRSATASQMRFAADFVVQTRVWAERQGIPEVSLTLLDTRTNEALWADRRVIDLDGEKAGYRDTVKSMLAAVIGSIERAELTQFRRSGLPNAYRYYLMGRHFLRNLTLPDIRRARLWFRNASDIDPSFARARSWYAHTLVLEWIVMTGKDAALLSSAQQAARFAIDLDPADANGYRALARAQLFRGQMDESLEGFETAERHAPYFADLLADYADTLVHNSQAAPAKQKMDLALENLERMRNPDQAHRLMAACAAMLGDMESAHQYRDAALSIDPTFEIRTWIQRLPIKDIGHLELYATALVRAGFR